MWDKWKKRIGNFIWKEVEETVEVEPQTSNNAREEYTYQPQPRERNENVHARMAYQYPKNTMHRFPPAKRPMEPKEQRLEKPAYQRRHERKPNQNVKHVASQTEKQVDEKANKVYKKDTKKPFKPSSVPSPIYGFHNRNSKKEVEEIPAYQRKQMKDQEQQLTAYGLRENQIATTEIAAAEQGVSETITSDGSDHTGMQYHEVHSMLGTYTQQTKEPEQIEKKTEKLEPIIQLNKNRNAANTYVNKRENHVTPEKLPYNVLMNNQDKQYNQQRKIAYKTLSITPDVSQQNRSTRHAERETKKQEPAVNTINLQTTKELKQMDNRDNPKDPKDDMLHLPLHLLDDAMDKGDGDDSWILSQQELLEQTLKYFKVRAKVVHATQGPAVTRFEVQPEMGVKVSKVKNLSDDLKLNMSARDIRIEAPIPGKNTIGIEVPNQQSRMVGLQEIIGKGVFQQAPSSLTVALGLNIEGMPIMTDIQKMPHGLIAGATGSGKSVCINTILVSLLYKASHEDIKFLLIDPKMVELAAYNEIPHLISPVITDVKAATVALKWAVGEMEDRYDRFVHEGVRDIKRYNQRMESQNRSEEKMPYIVIVIDELADLMMVSPQDVEDAICRIAQKARACGIHLLLATQRPSVDVLTGLIKANIPTRIAFSVSSQVDSRTILDSGGAEKLLGKGDMLFVENGSGKTLRLQGPFVSDDEIERVTNAARSIAPPAYLFEQESLLEKFNVEEAEDELLSEAISFVVSNNGASTSLLQRHFKIGYNRAARLIDSLENKGIISGQNGSKQREILVSEGQVADMMQQ